MTKLIWINEPCHEEPLLFAYAKTGADQLCCHPAADSFVFRKQIDPHI